MTTGSTERLTRGSAYAERGPQWLLVVEGAARLESGGAVHLLQAGDAVLVAARHQAVLTTCEGTTLAVNDLALVVPSYPLPSVLVVRDFAERHSGIAALVRLCPVVTQCGPELMTAGYANLLGSAMTASWLEDQGLSSQAPPTDPVVATVVAAVTDRPGEAWTVERMAGLVHLSRSALGERFRRELGRSPAEVLRDARMQEARRLLRGSVPGSVQGAVQVEQVAHAVGYGSAAAFSRAFAAQHGVPPQAWRAASSRSATLGPAGTQHREGQPARRRQDGAQHQSRHDSVPVDERAS
nr:AraC family transcriptional regulator [Nocardioides plantarum]